MPAKAVAKVENIDLLSRRRDHGELSRGFGVSNLVRPAQETREELKSGGISQFSLVRIVRWCNLQSFSQCLYATNAKVGGLRTEVMFSLP